MDQSTSFRFVALNDYNLSRSNKKGLSAIRKQLDVAPLIKGSESIGEEVRINKTTRTVRMPNGEEWNLGGTMEGEFKGCPTFMIWRSAESKPTKYPSTHTPWIEDYRQLALAQISYPWEQFETTLIFLSSKIIERGYRKLGTAHGRDNIIKIYMTIRDTPLELATTLAHEIGHIVDFQLLTPSGRDRWRHLRGFSRDYPWRGSRLRPDWKDPTGDFAECFAAWQVPGASVCVSKPVCRATRSLLSELCA